MSARVSCRNVCLLSDRRTIASPLPWDRTVFWDRSPEGLFWGSARDGGEMCPYLLWIPRLFGKSRSWHLFLLCIFIMQQGRLVFLLLAVLEKAEFHSPTKCTDTNNLHVFFICPGSRGLLKSRQRCIPQARWQTRRRRAWWDLHRRCTQTQWLVALPTFQEYQGIWASTQS